MRMFLAIRRQGKIIAMPSVSACMVAANCCSRLTDDDAKNADEDRLDDTVFTVYSVKAGCRNGLPCPIPMPVECTENNSQDSNGVLKARAVIYRLRMVMDCGQGQRQHRVRDCTSVQI